jgi:hypothetical protein
MDKIVTAKEMVTQTMMRLEGFKENDALQKAWQKTLLSLKTPPGSPANAAEVPYGEKLLAHCIVTDLKNGILSIETDHPGWSQLLHLHRGYILTGLNRCLPEAHITAVTFRLR